MQFVLNTFGAYLHRQWEMFRIKIGEEIKEISSREVNFELPDYIGLGKSVSRGFGTIKRVGE